MIQQLIDLNEAAREQLLSLGEIEGVARDIRAALEGGAAAGAAAPAGGGAADEALAAAGPYGAAAAAIKEKVGQALGGLQEGAKASAQAAQALARNDGLGAIDSGAKGAASALEGLSAAGVPFAGALSGLAKTVQAATAAVKPFADVVDAFVARGRQLAQFSPELSFAGARAEVESILADVREGQELGPDLARLTDAQTDLSRELRDMLLPIKKFVVEVLAGALEAVVEWTREARVFWRLVEKYMAELPAVLAASVNPFSSEATREKAASVIRNAIRAERALAEAERDAKRAVEADIGLKQIDQILKAAQAVLPLPVVDPAGGAAGVPLVAPPGGW